MDLEIAEIKNAISKLTESHTQLSIDIQKLARAESIAQREIENRILGLENKIQEIKTNSAKVAAVLWVVPFAITLAIGLVSLLSKA
ncbi:hypothetical protein D6779_11035 [Candidatus Parcubacteria bacterium]|nr:MAG: hypothetical protein D6779_11035 [Candidatus Parcubacteria bacterium]